MTNVTSAVAIGETAATADENLTWVIMCSGSPWLAAAHRQHAIAHDLAQRGSYRVLFVDPPANRARWHFSVTHLGDLLWRATVPSAFAFGRQLPPVNRLGRWLTARSLRRWLAERPGGRLLWIDEDIAAPLIGQLGETAVVYDATDLDWTFTRSWNRWNLKRALRSAVAGADLVLASSTALPAQLPSSRSKPIVLANACDPDLFQPDGPAVPWLTELPGPVLGYLGAVDTRAFDAELIATVATARPEWTFVLVGPSTKAGRAALLGLTNVHLFGAVSYEQAPAVIRSFDVALIPYRTGGLIDYVHPKKLYEYLAVGKPVVATALPALLGLNAPIRLAVDSAAFTEQISAALIDAADPAQIAERRAVAVANRWQVRCDELTRLLAGLARG
jgi:glycosyltransferase involved in cell wall biosynthesis